MRRIRFSFFSSRRRHTRCSRDWSSDVCSSNFIGAFRPPGFERRELGQIIEGLAVQHETLTEQAVELELPGELGDCEEVRSEEHTSELQSRLHLVCRLLLEKKKTQ